MESLISRPGRMTAHQVAEQLGISLGAVRLLVHRGRLTRVGGTPRQPWYDTADVTAEYRRRHGLDTQVSEL